MPHDVEVKLPVLVGEVRTLLAKQREIAQGVQGDVLRSDSELAVFVHTEPRPSRSGFGRQRHRFLTGAARKKCHACETLRQEHLRSRHREESVSRTQLMRTIVCHNSLSRTLLGV